MNFTKSNAYATHSGTGHRQHQDSAVVPTVWSADDANMLIWSLMKVLADAGVAGVDFDADVPDTYNRLSLALQTLSSVPIGTVVASYFTPGGATWVQLKGELFNRADYPAVVTMATAAGIVVSEATWAASAWTQFGAGDGSTTMRWPDLRGESIRGLDAGRGVDAGRTLATWQDSMVKRHKHVMAVGEHLQTPFGGTTTPENGIGASDSNNERPYTNDGSDYDGSATNPAGVIGDETRVRNVALPFWMKARLA